MDFEEGNLIHSITSNTERGRIEEEIYLNGEEEG